jgi:CarboxypepD_reg-like domain/TonB-dependent Receptor Plug Domain
MNIYLKILVSLLLSVWFQNGFSQAILKGKIFDEDNSPVFLANITVKGTTSGTMTDNTGEFEFIVPIQQKLTVTISCIGYKSQELDLTFTKNEERFLRIILETDISTLNEVSVSTRREYATTLRHIDISALQLVPSTSGSIESLIKVLPGVSSNNELSSQYSVRGGNFDENLVYVNDVEIYRPLLVRSGQQEGLSFINADLVSEVNFSAGGFSSRYGDKMSSVLDIKYKEPNKFGAAVSGSLLGGSAEVEGLSKDQKFSYLAGFRYKTTAYLLNTLETSGEYKPNFTDFQSLFSYALNPKMKISFLSNVSSNKYSFVPQTRTTEFGTSNNPLNLVIYYEGNELDRFETMLGALTFEYKPNPALRLKLISSGFSTTEEETYDILGQYLINELDNTIGSDTYGDSILNIGIGSFLNHARNYLKANVYSASHIGDFTGRRHKLKWGIKYESQKIDDHLSEWQLIDSSGFSLPYNGTEVQVQELIKSENHLKNTKVSAFFTDTWYFKAAGNEYYFTAGLRSTYTELNNQFFLSPRASFSYKPKWEKDIMFQLSGGLYYQPPFYREMRDPYGNINTSLKAQKSEHIVLGSDYIFKAWQRPFKFSTELYLKLMQNLVPYKVDNVRIRYAGENIANGFATGIDFKVNGEFVKGVESWVSLSFMHTKEDIEGDQFIVLNENGDNELVKPGYYLRPTNQLMNFGLFFQDYLPNNPDYKVHLNFQYGSRLPYSSPDKNRYDNNFNLPPYRRVDIGFSKVLLKENRENSFPFINNAWLSAEIFNLLGINNTISYLWVRTVANQANIPGQFAVPNYLTGRRFNVKLSLRF